MLNRPWIWPLLITCMCGTAASTSAQPKPNIILILADDQGWTGLSAPMDPNGLGPLSASDFYETPHLEMLVAQGMRFRQAYSASPNCSPTRAAIQTGMSPASLNLTDIVGRGDIFTNGVNDSFYSGNDLVAPVGASRLPAGVQSIAQRIKAADAGYMTAHFGKWHLTTPSVQPSVPGGPVTYVPGDPSDYGYDVSDGARGNNPNNSPNDPKEMFSLTERAIAFMNDRTGANGAEGDNLPFYLQISHYATHAASHTLATTQAKYDQKLINDPGIRHPDGAANTTFAGMTEDLDSAVGEMMAYLDSTPDPRNPGHILADNTYVFYTADNGATEAQSSNLPLFGEKASTWEGGIRVPFIVRGPGIAPNTVSNVPVVSTDLHATISSLAGVTAPLPDTSESADLTGILTSGGGLPADVNSLQRGIGTHSELFFHFPHYQHAKGTTPMSAMIDGDGHYKLVRVYGAAGTPTKDYLFDLTTAIAGPFDTWETDDRDDSRNLASDPAYADQLASMQQRFEAWLQEVDASLPYEVGAPVKISWDADDNSRQRGLEGPAWRSVTDVDHRPREQLLIDDTSGSVSLVSISPTQTELGTKAFHVKSGGGFKRTFFHVSELNPASNRLTAPADIDDSASFEFWFRADQLNQGQVLLETGGGDKGLSITLGDGDNDGQFNDVRLRAASDSSNQAIVTTASLAGTNGTSEFVHLVAVIKENTQAVTQVAQIYINGALATESDVVLGGGTVDWDGTNAAGIAMVQGALGGSGGPGPGALGTAGYAGDIAQFTFFNYALSAAEIERRSVFDFTFLEGDLNQDGMLDANDVFRFKDHWLSNTANLSPVVRYYLGDLDSSGRVDLADWVILRKAFLEQGQTAIVESLDRQMIPEPGGAALVLILVPFGTGGAICRCQRSLQHFRQDAP